jgi:hypothetical protein
MSDVNNKIDIKGDGSVVIYQRLKFGSPTEINKVFQNTLSGQLIVSETTPIRSLLMRRVIPRSIR